MNFNIVKGVSVKMRRACKNYKDHTVNSIFSAELGYVWRNKNLMRLYDPFLAYKFSNIWITILWSNSFFFEKVEFITKQKKFCMKVTYLKWKEI